MIFPGEIKEELLNLVYPRNIYCICCGNIIDETRTYSLCDHCMLHISWDLAPARVMGPNLKMIRCTGYGIYERSIIFALKYDEHKYIAETIGEIMRDRLEMDSEWEYYQDALLVPVPMHKKKERRRGFNHARLIAEKLSDFSGLEMVDALMRIRETLPMRGLGPEERAANISGAMKVKPYLSKKVVGRKILLIDDFCTTGSTGGECARALLQEGAKEVSILVFAARIGDKSRASVDGFDNETIDNSDY